MSAETLRELALEAAACQHFDSLHEAVGTAPYEQISERTRRIYRRQIEGTVDAVLAVVAADEYEPSEVEGTRR